MSDFLLGRFRLTPGNRHDSIDGFNTDADSLASPRF